MLLSWKAVLYIAGIWRSTVFGDASILPTSQFETLSYEGIVREVMVLAAEYPHLAQVYSAQERYNLPSPGPCSKDGSVMCEQWVLHVSDHSSLPASSERPEVFLSGCLHGDEQVGPNAVLEAAKAMVYAAVCQADDSAKECGYEGFKGAPGAVPWLARLTLTRSTVIMPMANSIGYYRVERTENKQDPNRDFPFHRDPSQCMKTIAARAVNEVWREHIFQLAITFHGGMVAMAYEWGSPDHPNKKNPDGSWQDVSPDHGAQEQVTKGLSSFAGSFKADGKTFEAYPSGRMNELVYAVTGGMEDWAYAGSWHEGVAVCKPKTYGGYPGEKTVYNAATLRALNILVETSAKKHPSNSLLGWRTGMLEDIPSTKEHTNGHVARNVRLSLALIDLVEPYVEWKPPDHFPAGGVTETEGRSRIVVVEDGMDSLALEWTVGGAFRVDATHLVWGEWPENAGSLSRRDWEGLVATAADKGNSLPFGAGLARWGGQEGEVQTTFWGQIDFGMFGDGWGMRRSVRRSLARDEKANMFVVASATVDQSWANQSLKPSPDVGPQSHFVNARTSEEWFYESSGHIVRGRKIWLSPPLKIVDKASLTSSSGPLPSAPPVEVNGKGSKGKDSLATWQQVSLDPSASPLSEHSGAKVSKDGRVSVVLLALALLLVLIVVSVVRAGGSGWGYFLPSLWLSRSKLRRSEDSIQPSEVELHARYPSGDLNRRRQHEGLRSGTREQRGSAETKGLLYDVDDRPQRIPPSVDSNTSEL